jgi:hypothetical protein
VKCRQIPSRVPREWRKWETKLSTFGGHLVCHCEEHSLFGQLVNDYEDGGVSGIPCISCDESLIGGDEAKKGLSLADVVELRPVEEFNGRVKWMGWG